MFINDFVDFVNKYRLKAIWFCIGFTLGLVPFLLISKSWLFLVYCIVQFGVAVTLNICVNKEEKEK